MSNNKRRVRDVVVGPGSSLQRVCKGEKKYKTEKDYSCYFFKCVFFFQKNIIMQFAMLPWSTTQKSKVVKSSQRRRRDQTGATYHR